MAQKVTIVLIDDIDGGEATETIAFSLDGANYEIDLNDDNAAKLRDAVAPFVGHARKVTGGPARRGARRAAGRTDGPNAKDVRAWAAANNYKVSDRGRVPADVVAAYEAAN